MSDVLIANKKLASKYGINAAIVFQRIAYWVDRNKKNQVNFRDGKYWTYFSFSDLTEQFEYLYRRTIVRIIQELKDNNLIISKQFTDNKHIRSNWYAVTDEGWQYYVEDGGSGDDGYPDGDKRTIPDDMTENHSDADSMSQNICQNNTESMSNCHSDNVKTTHSVCQNDIASMSKYHLSPENKCVKMTEYVCQNDTTGMSNCHSNNVKMTQTVCQNDTENAINCLEKQKNECVKMTEDVCQNDTVIVSKRHSECVKMTQTHFDYTMYNQNPKGYNIGDKKGERRRVEEESTNRLSLEKQNEENFNRLSKKEKREENSNRLSENTEAFTENLDADRRLNNFSPSSLNFHKVYFSNLLVSDEKINELAVKTEKNKTQNGNFDFADMLKTASNFKKMFSKTVYQDNSEIVSKTNCRFNYGNFADIKGRKINPVCLVSLTDRELLTLVCEYPYTFKGRITNANYSLQKKAVAEIKHLALCREKNEILDKLDAKFPDKAEELKKEVWRSENG